MSMSSPAATQELQGKPHVQRFHTQTHYQSQVIWCKAINSRVNLSDEINATAISELVV